MQAFNLTFMFAHQNSKSTHLLLIKARLPWMTNLLNSTSPRNCTQCTLRASSSPKCELRMLGRRSTFECSGGRGYN
jgi:hypothetical protein